MASSRGEDSDISDSEVADYEEALYLQLKWRDDEVQVFRVQNPDGTLRCPFCPGRRKHDYRHRDLLQHADGVGASPARKARARAAHRALARFLRTAPGCSSINDPAASRVMQFAAAGALAEDADGARQFNHYEHLFSTSGDGAAHVVRTGVVPPVGLELEVPLAANTTAPAAVDEPKEATPNIREDKFVYPWTGILVNLPTKVDSTGWRQIGESGSRMKRQLARFNPIRVRPIWNYFGHSGSAVVDFNKDWKGFNDAMTFERHFHAVGLGKADWAERKKMGDRGTEVHGWVARTDDYYAEGPVADHLQKNGDLKTVEGLSAEDARKKEKLVTDLTNQIEEKNKHLQEMEMKWNLTSDKLETMMAERNKLHRTYTEEVQKVRNIASEHCRKIFEENEKLRSELEIKCNQLDAIVAENDLKRKSLDDDRLKSTRTAFRKAAMEQKKADKNVLNLIEEQKKEKEAALKKILQLEKQLDAKQKLELEIQQLKGNLQIMNHLGGKEDAGFMEKISEMNEELKEKIEEMEDMEALNQALVIKERLSNDELQEARKEAILGLSKMLTSKNSHIGIKRLGEIDIRPFKRACKEKFDRIDHEKKAAELCSKWQQEIQSSEWHPYKRVFNDEEQVAVDEDDEKLKELKLEFGDEVHKAVCVALTEIILSNPTGRYIVEEIWNFKDGRKATLEETIQYVLKKWKSVRRK